MSTDSHHEKAKKWWNSTEPERRKHWKDFMRIDELPADEQASLEDVIDTAWRAETEEGQKVQDDEMAVIRMYNSIQRRKPKQCCECGEMVGPHDRWEYPATGAVMCRDCVKKGEGEEDLGENDMRQRPWLP